MTSRRNITWLSSWTVPPRRPVIIASTEGGVDIEEVAESSPEKILKGISWIQPWGCVPTRPARLHLGWDLSGDSFKQCVKLGHQGDMLSFWTKDCSQVEVNPSGYHTFRRCPCLGRQGEFRRQRAYFAIQMWWNFVI